MGNLCSIFHSRFKNLIKIIPCARKAQLMDYILLGWQTSTYKLKNSDKKWFMKPHDEIVEETQIKLSTLRDYLKEFEEQGFIERRQARYNRKKSNGEYYVTMGGYISITDKFITLLKAEPNNQPKSSPETNTNNPNPHDNEKQNEPNSSFFDEIQRIDSLKTGESYIRDLHTRFNNNIKFKQLINSVDKPTLDRLIYQYGTIQKFINTEIKEEISEEIKKLVLGTFFNLTFEHKKQFSVPEQIAAEYLFSLINTEFCLPEVHDFKHRNYILSKIIRKNNWKTPKGFYNHFYMGQDFKDKQELREKQWEDEKRQEIQQPKEIPLIQQDNRLASIEAQILEKGTLIEELTHSIYLQTSEELILSIREKIQTLKAELNSLWNEQWVIEREIEQEGIGIKLCA